MTGLFLSLFIVFSNTIFPQTHSDSFSFNYKNSSLKSALDSLIHQHQVVGSYSMIGMGCVAPKKVRLEPGQTWVGNPARRLKTNMYALDKYKIDEYYLIEETARFRQLVKDHGL